MFTAARENAPHAENFAELLERVRALEEQLEDLIKQGSCAVDVLDDQLARRTREEKATAPPRPDRRKN